MKSRKVAFGGVMAALSLAVMLMTGVIPIGTYAFPAIAGVLLTFIVIEFGFWWAIGVYAAVSLLSFLLVADKEAALYYTLILGVYPVLKSVFERIRVSWVSFLLKLLFFNLVAIAAFFISIHVLLIPAESFSVGDLYVPWVFLILGNVVFVVYDISVTRIVSAYINVWRKRFKFH